MLLGHTDPQITLATFATKAQLELFIKPLSLKLELPLSVELERHKLDQGGVCVLLG